MAGVRTTIRAPDAVPGARMGYNFPTMEDLSLLWIPAGTFAILAAVILMFFIFN